jgi:hypothetical protein
MNTVDILKVLSAGIILFILWHIIYKYVIQSGANKTDTFTNSVNLMNAAGSPGNAPVEMQQPPVEPPRQIASSGPNPPDQRMNDNVRYIMAEEQPNDPYAETVEDAHAPERLRHPEGMFRPAPEMDGMQLAAESGVASHLIQANNKSAQQFNPEFAQNGGVFMDGIMANDDSMHVGYSMF